MPHRLLLSWAACAWGISVLPALGLEPAATGVTMDAIESAWRARQAKTKNIWIEYDTVTLIPNGLNGVMSHSGETIYPEGDSRLTRRQVFVWDGARSRYEFWGHIGSHLSGKWEPQHYVSVHNGTTDKRLVHGIEGASREVHPLAWDCPGKINNDDVATSDLWPVMATYRSLDFGTSILIPRSATMTPDADVINGSSCLRISSKPRPSQTHVAWLDPKRAFLPVRIQVLNHDTRHPEPWLVQKVEIEYEESPSTGIRLRAWRSILFADTIRLEELGRIWMDSTFNVTATRLNVQIEPAVFDLGFPENAEVTDCSGASAYIALKGGKRRPILQAERVAKISHDDLIKSEPGELVPAVTQPTTGAGFKWLLVAVGIAVLIGAALLFRRRAC